MEVGGRMFLRDPDTLILTLGDHDFAGVESQQILAQDPEASYGKILLLHLAEGRAEVLSMGHRNPQGLFVDRLGQVWETEHGPQGGDELNLIIQGANYGWPLVTYGTDYGAVAWVLSHDQGQHEGYDKPVFAWVPSIGVSNLVRLQGVGFPLWKDDLLVGSLHGKSLFRIRLDNHRVVFAEPIEIGERVRDLIEGPD